MTRPIEVVGHGGAGDFYPGNSRQALAKALEIGVDRVEVDVQRSLDGDLVLVHDDRIRVDQEHSRPVSELTTDELRAALPGLLTLDEAVALVSGRVPFMLDIKRRQDGGLLIEAIRRHGLAAQSSVSCEDLRLLRRLRRAFPEMRLGLSMGHWSHGAPTRFGRAVVTKLLQILSPYPIVGAAKVSGATEVMLYHPVGTRRLVETLQNHDLRVNVWTVDRPASMRRAIGLGVDGIITNRPDLLWEELAKTGARNPSS